ncbi:hypothetical protein [Mesorhizobium sp. J8]|uniref:hypothetical protein n=1 Tax=Mesorhizobium sp. J8 TaxID=2777475 RepID=UPI00191634B4|nr:hypothetical protein [Mesorhizobium sp. J8]BCM18694.1 hypothetical protein MJ8_24660 [Mesorhizobium sp. J8]
MARTVAIEHLTLDGVFRAPARADEDMRYGFGHGGWGIPGSAPQLPPFRARTGASALKLSSQVTTATGVAILILCIRRQGRGGAAGVELGRAIPVYG